MVLGVGEEGCSGWKVVDCVLLLWPGWRHQFEADHCNIAGADHCSEAHRKRRLFTENRSPGSLKTRTWLPQIKIFENPKDLVTGVTSGVYFRNGVCKTCLEVCKPCLIVSYG